ncbi:MAG TPA: hypothetical protein VGR47_06665 [Terracidiphilus sp.]|nr:hypothetical protein [Terracidiphilus sp.]HEV2400653.1 hypothetical protein [Candidatus Sulfotelmatobacter sp.]
MPFIRTTLILPGAIETELGKSVKHEATAQAISEMGIQPIPPESIANAIAYAISQPADVAVNEIIVRPAGQAL